MAVIAAACVELSLDLGKYVLSYLVAALGVQLVHQFSNQLIVEVGSEEQQTLEVGRNQDVHRRRSRGEEITVAVVLAALLEEVRQHVVAVGRADELVDRQTHFLGDVRRKDVAEVARRYADVDLVALCNGACGNHIAVRRNVVRDLRRQTAPVDGVCRGQHHAVLVERCAGILIGEDALYRALCIVKVAADGYNLDVPAFLRYHLQLLHGRYAVHRIVHHNLGARYIVEAVERCLAGVTRCSDQNAGGTGFAGLAQGRSEQVRQHLQRHILERAGRTVPQLEQVLALAQLYHRCGICTAELFIGVGLGRKVRQLLRRKVGQELAENERRAALVIALRKRFPIRVGKRGKRGRAVQAAVRCDTVGDGVCRGNLALLISCAYIIHIFTTSAVVLIAPSIV